MRKAPEPDIVIPTAKLKVDDNVITQEREYELITPLFGGGVEPGECDRLTPIRGTEIRGHLRFWWRATRGGQFGGKLKRMKQAEDILWGAASTEKEPRPSQVHLIVEKVVAGQALRYRELDPDIQYAAFPLQEGEKAVSGGLKFSLRISFPKKIEYQDEQGKHVLEDVADEIEASLWAWETFGGIGARTRRGFGALRLTQNSGQPFSLSPAPTNAKEVRLYIEEGLSMHLAGDDWPEDFPHLSADIWCYRSTQFKRSSNDAWKTVMGELKRFRQHRLVTREWDAIRNRNVPRFERSRWPESDSIRKRTMQWLKAGVKSHDHPGHEPNPNNLGKFPRAAFGLPIVFHFKDSDERNPRNPNRDPRDVVLRLAGHDRLASPLILRPLCLGDGKYTGLAVMLAGTLQPEDFHSHDVGLILTEKNGTSIIAHGLIAQLSPNEAKSIKEVGSSKPLLADETDPVIAFLDRIQKEDE